VNNMAYGQQLSYTDQLYQWKETQQNLAKAQKHIDTVNAGDDQDLQMFASYNFQNNMLKIDREVAMTEGKFDIIDSLETFSPREKDMLRSRMLGKMKDPVRIPKIPQQDLGTALLPGRVKEYGEEIEAVISARPDRAKFEAEGLLEGWGFGKGTPTEEDMVNIFEQSAADAGLEAFDPTARKQWVREFDKRMTKEFGNVWDSSLLEKGKVPASTDEIPDNIAAVFTSEDKTKLGKLNPAAYKTFMFNMQSGTLKEKQETLEMLRKMK